MRRLVRVIAGLACSAFTAIYYGVAQLFIHGSPSDDGYSFAFGTFGMLGIGAPVFLCGLHLAFFGKTSALAARIVMASALGLSLAVSIVAMLPFALATPPHPEAGNTVIGALWMTALFGAPIIRGVFLAIMARNA